MRDLRAPAQRWARWLLPLLALRAVLPAGFMPVFDAAGGVSFGLCPGVERTAAPEQHLRHLKGADAHRHAHVDHASSRGKPQSSTHTTACPFAVAASAAPAAVLPAIVPVGLVAIAPTPVVTDQVVMPSVIRAQSPRAPPR
jgi:hypothetical protein